MNPATGSRILASCASGAIAATRLADTSRLHRSRTLTSIWTSPNGTVTAGNEMVEQSSPAGTGIAKGLPVTGGNVCTFSVCPPAPHTSNVMALCVPAVAGSASSKTPSAAGVTMDSVGPTRSTTIG